MGMDTGAYKKITLDHEGLHYEESYDKLNGRTKNYFKYPNGELFKIAKHFYEVSKGDIDFRYYIKYDEIMDFYEDTRYAEKCQQFYAELKSLDFEQVVKDLEKALAYYDAYELDFTPSYYHDETDRELVEYLLELAKQKYYILYDV